MKNFNFVTGHLLDAIRATRFETERLAAHVTTSRVIAYLFSLVDEASPRLVPVPAGSAERLHADLDRAPARPRMDLDVVHAVTLSRSLQATGQPILDEPCVPRGWWPDGVSSRPLESSSARDRQNQARVRTRAMQAWLRAVPSDRRQDRAISPVPNEAGKSTLAAVFALHFLRNRASPRHAAPAFRADIPVTRAARPKCPKATESGTSWNVVKPTAAHVIRDRPSRILHTLLAEQREHTPETMDGALRLVTSHRVALSAASDESPSPTRLTLDEKTSSPAVLAPGRRDARGRHSKPVLAAAARGSTEKQAVPPSGIASPDIGPRSSPSTRRAAPPQNDPTWSSGEGWLLERPADATPDANRRHSTRAPPGRRRPRRKPPAKLCPVSRCRDRLTRPVAREYACRSQVRKSPPKPVATLKTPTYGDQEPSSGHIRCVWQPGGTS